MQTIYSYFNVLIVTPSMYFISFFAVHKANYLVLFAYCTEIVVAKCKYIGALHQISVHYIVVNDNLHVLQQAPFY